MRSRAAPAASTASRSAPAIRRSAARRTRALALALAGTAERRARDADRLRGLTAEADLGELGDLLARQRLLPLLGGRVLRTGAPVPPVFTARVQEAMAAAERLARSHQTLTLRALAALDAVGIPAVALKGPLLSERLHGAPGLRPSTDIDLLLTRDAIARATAALEELGWVPSGERTTWLHHRLVHPSGLPPVELHWRVHWYEARFAPAALERAEPAPEGGRRLAPADLLACLALVYARDGLAGLRHPADIAAWWDRHGATTPEPLAGVVREHPELRRALGTACAVAAAVTGLPAATHAGGRLPVSATAARLANPLLDGGRSQVAAEMSLVDGLLAPRGGRRAFLRRQVLLDARLLHDRRPALRSAGPLRLAWARAAHAVRVLARYGLAVGHAARPA